MSNSKLVTYTALTNNMSKGRGTHKIDKIFVHHMAGNLTVQMCGNVFKNRSASAHYGINGKNIGQYVLEENTAWHCGNFPYNQRSIGIECANDGGASTNWHVSDTTIQTLITLLVDICKRNGIKKLNFTGDLTGNLVMHCYTQATACPGGYLKTKFKYIASEVTKKLNANSKDDDTKKTELYRVRKTWNDASSQLGAFTVLENAKKVADESGYNVYASNGKLVYQPKKTELYRVRKTWKDADSQLGAFSVLANAKALCDKNPGYSVFDSNGKAVYTNRKSPSLSEIYKPLTDACKAQTSWSYSSKYEWESKPTVPKSKLKGTCVTYVACCLQRIGALLPGEYIWHDGSGYGNGKVYGDNKWMTVTYTNNKTPSQLKDKLQVGDVVMIDDNKSGVKKDGGHTEIFAGTIDSSGNATYYSGGLGSGHNTSNTHKDKRKILAIVRVNQCRVETYVQGGTIDPWVYTVGGIDVTINYKPDSGKKISELWIDKKKVDIGSNKTSYTFKRIWTNHVIKVVFK